MPQFQFNVSTVFLFLVYWFCVIFHFQLICIALCSLTFVCADNIDKNAEIRSFQSDASDAEGNYQFSYETSNGIQRQEAGSLAGVRGSLNYVSPEGERISLSYTADEEGFHPTGDHLPTPPSVPAYVLRSLEYIRAHPPQLKEEQ